MPSSPRAVPTVPMLFIAFTTLSTCLASAVPAAQEGPEATSHAVAEATQQQQQPEPQQPTEPPASGETDATPPAQQSPEATPPPEAAGKHRSTVVRGTRPAQSAAEVTIGRDILDTAPRMNATDVLRVVPGLVASQHSGEGKAQQLFLRGFDALHGQDVELNVGGLPVNEVSHIHALGYADTNFIIPELVQALEVTEGSYRAFQGDFAVAGTVRMDLGAREKGVEFAGTLGQFNMRRLVVTVRPGEDPGTFAAAELSESDGFGPQRGYGRATLLAQANLDLGHGLSARILGGSYVTRFDSPGVVREDDLEAGRRTFYSGSFDRQGGTVSRHQLLIGVDLPREGTARTRLEAFGILSDLRLRNNFTGYRVDDRGDGLEQTHDGSTLGLRAEHRRQVTLFDRPVALELGLGARRDGLHQTQRRYRETDGTFFADEVDADLTQTDVWGYAEARLPLGRWAFRLGGRADALGVEVFDALAFRDPRYYDGQGYSRSAFGVHWGAKAGIEYAVTDTWALFASYGDGFRSPQARSLAEGEQAPFVNVHGAELGTRKDGERLSFQAIVFGSQVANDFFFDHTVGTTVFTGETLRTGISASLQARPLEGVTAALSATVANATVTKTDAKLPYFAPLVARADIGWEKPLPGIASVLSLGTGLTLIGPRPLPYDEYSHTVLLADVQAELRRGALALRLDVKNVFNTRWRDGEFVYSSRFDPTAQPSLVPARHFTAGAPRVASLTLEVHL
ncbi:TonB-dependent receptor [Corallococcus coralloides DSM 2259]|uniref:TonB-dependent receptor n=1 Tax=Corallococcus coralloides (strain ATCC 25202 / DSM 2259 / NBRC 100086 / M2) TaxID=1144275 RepID=H8MUY9_CORCM|nr:TonB-dependent receptor [Corallococcus coralloides DSM 2259]